MPDRPSQLSSEQTTAVVEAARARDHKGVAVIATDAAGIILYWNDGAALLYGWEPEEALGRNVLDVTPTRNSTDSATQIMEELRVGQEWTGEFIVKRRDGTPMMAHVSNYVVREKEAVIGIVGISRPAGRKTPPGGVSRRNIAD
jgi:PAS domain S-box-containing protein